MDTQRLAALLFPEPLKTPEEYEAMYPKRTLPEGAKVTRLGPSPTGFIHLGNLYGALADERLAHQSGGKMFLRIEDTDNKREVEGAAQMIVDTLRYFGISFDEGDFGDSEIGEYGPYRQRRRVDIYHAYAKKLVLDGKAYPCFCTEEALSQMHEKQEAEKANFGYYGKWATHRDWTLEQIEEAIGAGMSYVLRFRSDATGKTFTIEDGIRGELTMPENDNDFVLLKSDGVPTYHFAHAVDDHLMRTTHVVRGEEWLATLPIHVQLFEALGFELPTYCHTAQLMKIDEETNVKRKISKRKDPEFSLSFYKTEGYDSTAVREYLLMVLNSGFEDWRLQNPGLPFTEFMFSAENMGVSGAVFDLNKLNDVCKNVLATKTADEIYDAMAVWAKEYDPEYYALFTRDPAFSKAFLSIGRGGEKPRKDLYSYKQAKTFNSFFFDELFEMEDSFPENISSEDIKKLLTEYLASYNHSDDQSAWFSKVRDIAEANGFAPQVKQYKKDPDAYKGHIGDVSAVIRIALTGRSNAPDLWCVQQVLGEEKTKERLGRI